MRVGWDGLHLGMKANSLDGRMQVYASACHRSERALFPIGGLPCAGWRRNCCGPCCFCLWPWAPMSGPGGVANARWWCSLRYGCCAVLQHPADPGSDTFRRVFSAWPCCLACWPWPVRVPRSRYPPTSDAWCWPWMSRAACSRVMSNPVVSRPHRPRCESSSRNCRAMCGLAWSLLRARPRWRRASPIRERPCCRPWIGSSCSAQRPPAVVCCLRSVFCARISQSTWSRPCTTRRR